MTYPVNSPALSYWVTTEKRLSPQGSDLVPFSGRVYDHHLDNWRYETKQKNAGWWFQPLWKILVNCQWEGLSHISWKNNVPNHQLDWVRLIGHWDITNRLWGSLTSVLHALRRSLMWELWQNDMDNPRGNQRKIIYMWFLAGFPYILFWRIHIFVDVFSPTTSCIYIAIVSWFQATSKCENLLNVDIVTYKSIYTRLSITLSVLQRIKMLSHL